MVRAHWFAAATAMWLSLSPALAEETAPPPGSRPFAATQPAASQPVNTAVVPVPRDQRWLARHEGFVAQARAGQCDVLFLGDSITDNWRGPGKSAWQRAFGDLRALNFGISGDRTQHLLWRLQNGELDGIQPKVVVLLIGTNNCGTERGTDRPRNATPEVIEGVSAVVHELRQRLPGSRIVLLAIFPRSPGPRDAIREQVATVNQGLAKLDDGRHVRYLDIGRRFLADDGTLPATIMPDALHLSETGYQIWADALLPVLREMMGGPASAPAP